jgi:2-polyprenyl-6-methoxyphenol hydroxylase-like FAD-dependent oxidoreductase
VAEFPKDGKIPFDKNLVRQIFGEGVRAGMYPLSDTSVYWFVCFNSERDWVARHQDKSDLRDALVSNFVARWNHGIGAVIDATPLDSLVGGAISDRWTSPLQEVGRGKITCAGDALHPMTPNLGQGGCCALEDAIVLANKLQGAIKRERNATEKGVDVDEALREFEKERLKRCLPLTVRANVMGQLLQIDNPVVCSVRNLVVEKVFNPKSFLDHTNFDCRDRD